MAHHRTLASLRSSPWRTSIALLALLFGGCGASRDGGGGDTPARSTSALRVLFLGETPANVDSLELSVADADYVFVLQDVIPLAAGQLTVSLPDGGIARFEVRGFQNATESVNYLGCVATRIAGAGTVTVRMFPADGPNQIPVIVTPPAGQTGTDGGAVSPFYILANDPDCDPLTYSAAGLPAGVAIDSLTGRVSGTIDPAASAGSPYSVTVTVAETDDPSASVTASFTWTVTPPAVNTPPVANAGPDQTVAVGDRVALDGSASSDANEDPLSYSWTFTPDVDSSAALSDPTAVGPTFVADLAGTYQAVLVVNDGSDDSAPDTVIITAEDVPSIIGVFSLSGLETLTGCLDPADNGSYDIAATADFTLQTGGSFSGTTSTSTPFPSTGPIDGRIAGDGSVSGTFGFQREIDGTVSAGTFTGTLVGDVLDLSFSGQDVEGDTCSFTGTLAGTRAQ